MSNEHFQEKIKSSKTDEHYTPDFILDFARLTLGCEQFDTDPSTTIDNPTGAKTFYTKETDGLRDSSKWSGNVFVNPPFSLNKAFSLKLLEELNSNMSVIYLAKAEFRTAWSLNLLNTADWIMPVKGYVQYVGSEHSALFSTILYGFNLDESNLRDAMVKYQDRFGLLENFS